LAASFFALGDFGRPSLFLSLLDCIEQTLTRQFAVLCLRSQILHSNADPARSMSQRYSARNLVDILTARTCRSSKTFLKIGVSNTEALHSLGQRVFRHYSVLHFRNIVAPVPEHARHPNQFVQKPVNTPNKILIEQISMFVEQGLDLTEVYVFKNRN
jgi:hypothetical protein